MAFAAVEESQQVVDHILELALHTSHYLCHTFDPALLRKKVKKSNFKLTWQINPKKESATEIVMRVSCIRIMHSAPRFSEAKV